jgi:predicted outer membrane repeat protein
VGTVPGVTVRDSVLSANSAVEGGGIYNFSGIFDNNQLSNGTLEVQGSTFSGNTASDSGGAIYNLGTATVQGSTLSGNAAGSAGGGIFNGASGTLAVKDSTVLGNAAPGGADLYTLGSLALDDSTVGLIGP